VAFSADQISAELFSLAPKGGAVQQILPNSPTFTAWRA